ncbi:DUF3212 family protein [Bacillus swezeyi]|uniref:DUF3212 domain-containing protein n=1 Tax=Bacillus swezeyi TaxID=1925020 RepID=A0A1R1RTJ5_9BACI|nr:DUF3212 family protein [Bacillus swezeyi]MEC1259751.1 DUF3212 family protein [Bacillus swezeyi]MED2930137.1 DUF3212 family protein [Bacillus swezeyi]MED2944800.1 DUF3212 family protein [Bacillus swezeyi]MED2962974.1 DUF3212 family protein [Bacillus swezeyi]MED2976321.1 DUF3212 family protein [Bacillus swezeyi]
MNYFSPEQQYNAWIICDLTKQILSRKGHQEVDTHLLESFAARQFGINIDYVFSIIMNIGDPEKRTASNTEDILASYLFSLLPFITKDMIKDSRENANQYLLNERNADVYHLFLPDSVLQKTFH